MKNPDAIAHVKGASIYVDDITERRDVLHAAVFTSPLSHGKIKILNIQKAQQQKGVVAVLTAADIPGENQIGNIIADEPLFAEGDVHFKGQPLALVVAENQRLARAALSAIEFEADPLPVITDPREAYAKGMLIAPERTFLIGNPASMWDQCDHVIEGRVDSGGQEHFYIEGQAAMCLPMENGCLKVLSSTQAPTNVQRTVAKVLGLPMHKVEVDVRRLGGAFGGKEDQATPWAVLAALACFRLNLPVKLVLRRHEDITITGKRHPYSSDFKIGFSAEGKILAYEVKFFQNSGAAADLSTAILERTLFHTTNTYFIPHVKASAACCRTNLPPFTAFRGFGAPQAMFVVESAIYKAAKRIGITPHVLQKKNLLKEGDGFPYGMQAENCRAIRCFEEAEKTYAFGSILKQIKDFNGKHKMLKKGVAAMPVCFGISFTNTVLNQASALVHVYYDGSVSISTAAVEMGQGVNTKIIHVAARTFRINPQKIKIETTNTTRIANTSPTAASSGADLNGRATQLACEQILKRLKQVAADELQVTQTDRISIRDETIYLKDKKTSLQWNELVYQAYLKRTSLSAHAYYASPNIYFDRTKEKGKPFTYHVYGTAITEVTVDCLRGTYSIDTVSIVHDVGESLHSQIDQGQVEGGLLQGIGWMTIEELLFDQQGDLITDDTSRYKIPDIKFAPQRVRIRFLENADNPYAVLSSKAVGEPPFMYGIGSYFALLEAVGAFNPQVEMVFNAPLTPEKVLRYVYSEEFEEMRSL